MLNEYTELLRLLNTTKNWREALAKKYITIKEDGELVLLKYNLIESDFNDPVVRACRGVILTRLSGTYGEWKIICAPFLKFSYGNEEWEKPIDWKTARVREKVDGSLIKLFYYKGSWRISTNSTIDANKAFVGDTDLTFADLFSKAVNDDWQSWANKYLDCCYTYMFELTAPENKVVIDYDKPKVWYLSRRNNFTLEEDDGDVEGLERPKLYQLTNIEDTLNVVKSMVNQEGVVVYDKDFNRIKIKSESYLTLHSLACNGTLSYKRIINMIIDGSIDDYIAYFGDKTGKIKEVQEKIKDKANRLQDDYLNVRKQFAEYVRENYPNSQNYLFSLWKNDFSSYDYICSMPVSKLTKIMRGEEQW